MTKKWRNDNTGTASQETRKPRRLSPGFFVVCNLANEQAILQTYALCALSALSVPVSSVMTPGVREEHENELE
jgi:hypothetical protein